MQAVILAAGKSTRTCPLTLTRPKALLPVANKPILQHNLENLRGLIDEAVIVVGYRKEMIEKLFGKKFQNIRITYVEQNQQLGTGHAVLSAEDYVEGRFMVMNGDDIYHRDNLQDVLDYDYSLLVEKVQDPSRFGVWVVEKNRVKGFAEKPKKFVSDIANCGLYVVDSGIFDCLRGIKKSERGEYEFNEAVNMFAKKHEVNCVVSNGKWLTIGYSWHLLEANEKLLREMKDSRIEGEVEPNATIKGAVSVGKGTIVLNGSYIEGPVLIGENCSIGPNCYIRPFTSIGNGCRIGNAVEIKNCIIMDNTRIGHLSYFGDSVLGFDVNIGGGSMAANVRHDRENVRTYVSEELVDTGRVKFGTVIGDCVKTGVNTSIYPGRKIWPGKHIMPCEIVKKDVT
jgi:bifunctional UDP-N-acetylglucosamine pyrophosphorylase/glucosamine-1-phosphate N-acetyltransferase